MSKYTTNNEMTNDTFIKGYAVVDKGDYSDLPKVMKARISHASVNSYGKGEDAGKMVTKKFKVEVKFRNEVTFRGVVLAADTYYDANEILVRAGVKTLPVYGDIEKARKGLESCRKWGRQEIVTEKKGKKSSKKTAASVVKDLGENATAEEKIAALTAAGLI